MMDVRGEKMDFNKIIVDMQNLQKKIDEYETRIKIIDENINFIYKDIKKLEKKLEKENDEINKNILNIKILILKNVVFKFENEGVQKNG